MRNLKETIRLLISQGWVIVGYGNYFTDDKGRKDRFVYMKDREGKRRSHLESEAE